MDPACKENSSVSFTEGNRVNIPDELRTLLLEFTVSYLLARPQPPDIIEYAVEFFMNLRDNPEDRLRYHALRPSSPDDSVTSVDDDVCAQRPHIRRKSVFAEAYDPEEDEDDTSKPIFPKSDQQRRTLAESVKNILLFRSLDQEQMNEVLDAMFQKEVHVGDVIIKQGDDGDNFYVIESGIYQTYINSGSGEDKLIMTYDNKGSFGELALLYNVPRAATIKAASSGALWALDRVTFRRIVLKNAFKKRKMYEALLDCVPMLKALQPYEKMNLADALIPKSYSHDQCIIKQGDAADGMYFVECGTIRITVKRDDGTEVEIKRIKKGEYLGELALVTHRPRAASAYAVDDVKVAFLDVDAFERLLGPCMAIMKRNINDYEHQIVKIFGSKLNLSDVR